MGKIKRFTLTVLAAALLALGFTLDVHADQPTPEKPSLRCLSENTVFAIDLPDPSAFIDVMRQRTRLGQLMFADERRDELIGMLQEIMDEEWDQMLEDLGRYELEPADLPRLIAGGAGAALTLEPHADREPVVVLLAWAEPGVDLAQRVISAADKAAADALAEGTGFERYDIALADHDVMHLSFPVEGLDRMLSWDLPDDWMDMSQEEQEAHWDRQWREQEEAEMIVLDRTHIMLTRAGGRLLLAATFPQSQGEVRAMDEADRAAVDWDQLTGLDEATGVFARFLARHTDDDGSFAEDIQRTPGLLAALPDGVALAEIYANPPVVLRLLQEAAGADDDAEEWLAFMNVLAELGLDSIGPMAFRMSLDQNVFRSDGFMSMPAPRSGILELLDQTPLAAEVPAWVSTEPTSYNHVSFDLAELYRQIRERVIAEVGDEARAGFEQAEQVVQMQAQSSIVDILGSIGHKHTLLTFETRMVETEVPDYSQFDPETGDFPMQTVNQPQQRMAFVWELRDAAVWERLFNVIGMWAGMMGDAIQHVEEQGFTGWRFEDYGMQMGLFHGRGHLVIAVGEEVAESVLAMLRTPPEGDAAMRNGALRADGERVLSSRPGLYYSIADYNRTLIEMRDLFVETFEQEFEQDFHGAGPLFDPTPFMQRLLPSEEELDGVVGVYVAQGYLNENGLVLQSALDLPPGE